VILGEMACNGDLACGDAPHLSGGRPRVSGSEDGSCEDLQSCRAISVPREGCVRVGLDHLFGERRAPGPWRVSLPRIAGLGIPLLILTVFNLPGVSTISAPLIGVLPSSGSFFDIVGTALGYVVITSFYKRTVGEANGTG